MTGTFDGLTHFALVFQAGARDTTGQNTALIVEQFQQEIGVFIIDVFNTGFLEAAVFFADITAVHLFVLEAHDYLASAVSCFFLPTRPFFFRSL